MALFEPEIAQNVGTIIRTCACFGFELDLIHPLGFVWHDKYVKRAGMDYIQYVRITHHDSVHDFFNAYKEKRIILADAHASQSFWDVSFQKQDVIMFGKESVGVPPDVRDRVDLCIHIPMLEGRRSLNLAVAHGIVASRVFS